MARWFISVNKKNEIKAAFQEIRCQKNDKKPTNCSESSYVLHCYKYKKNTKLY